MPISNQNAEILQLRRGVTVVPVCVLMMASLLFWQKLGHVAGKSALLGGLIALVPMLYFSLKTLGFKRNKQARQIVRSFYRAEAGKLILVAALFALVFTQVKTVNAVVLFVVFFCTQISGSLTPLFLRLQKHP